MGHSATEASGTKQTNVDAIRLAKAITDGSTNLLEVVESMGSALNSDTMVERIHALDTLAQLLRQLPEGTLIETEITSLLGYFVAQLKGHHPDTARIAIRALHTMFTRYTVSPGDAVMFVERFFNEAALVDLTRDDKMTLYGIFQSVFSNTAHLDAVAKQMSSAVLPGFLQLIELETDPQCLLICFKMFCTVVKSIPLGVYADDMFEYPAGYFPIDFNGSPNRHGGITRTDLQDSLEDCLLSHSSFSQPVINLCLEKIASDVRQAQIDALQLLKRAIDQYDPSVCYEYLDAIWPLLRKLHVAHREDLELQEGVFRVTTILARRLGCRDDGDAKLEQLASLIWKDFEDREAFLEHYGWRFIVAYAGGSLTSSEKILPKALAKVTHMIADENQISSSLLDASSAILQVFIGLHRSSLPADAITIPRAILGTTLLPAIEMLVGQACSLLLEPSCSNHLGKLLKLIEVALPIENILGKSELETIRRFIERSIVQQSLESTLSSTRPISPIALKSFIAACSTHYGLNFTANLRSLANEHGCVWLLAGLIQAGDHCGNSNNNPSDICSELFSIGSSEAFAAICEIVLDHPEETAPSVLEMLLSLRELPRKDIQEFEHLLTIVLQEMPTRYSVHETTLAGLHHQLSSTLNSVHEMLVLQLRVVLSNCPCRCLAHPLGTELAATLLKLADIVKDQSEKKAENLAEDDLMHGAASSENNLTTLVWQCVSLIANKHTENSETEWAVVSGVLGQGSNDGGDVPGAIASEQYNEKTKKLLGKDSLGVAYLAKGLVMRGHRRCEEALAMALENASRDIDAARHFAAIACPEPNVFPKRGHCILRLLYTQRLLTFAIPRFIEMFNNGNDSERLNISVAFCSIIQNVSRNFAEPYLSKLVPVVLWCLSQPSLPTEPSRGLVQCMRWSLSQLKLNLDNVLPALLRWSQRPASMDLRIEAMACLRELRNHFQVHELLPYKRGVLREMPVGDRKRRVRKAASTTALAWHMLGEGTR